MSVALLYTTLGCHLCEDAQAIIGPIILQTEWCLELVEIADSDDLVERYGIRIPVLARADTDAELGWPFTSVQVAELLNL